MESALKRYHIQFEDQVFNLNECGISFQDVAGRSRRKGIGLGK